MSIRTNSWRAAAALVATTTILEACGRPPRAPPAAEPLVIPPLARDAGASPSEPSPEPTEAPAKLTITARDPRIAKRRPRSRTLVISEVQAMERVIATTSVAAPERASAHRRLAEAESELAYTASGADADRARDEAIKHYLALAIDHPQAPQMDEVVYYLGLAYELNGDARRARQAYFDLITKHPSSKLVPYAYFAFGERYAFEAEADTSKNELAVQAYNEVLKYPPGDNPLFPYALLRLGETLRRMNDQPSATRMFDQLRRDFPSSSAAAEIPPDR